jgi:hypothetical protein
MRSDKSYFGNNRQTHSYVIRLRHERRGFPGFSRERRNEIERKKYPNTGTEEMAWARMYE